MEKIVVNVQTGEQTLEPMTAEELAQWESEQPTAEEIALRAKNEIKEQIAELERNALMPRGAREGWILLCEQQGAAAGLTKQQLYAANPFYKGLVDTDNAAKALRALL